MWKIFSLHRHFKKAQKLWNKLISMCPQLLMSSWQFSLCEFSKAWSLILRPEIVGIMILTEISRRSWVRIPLKPWLFSGFFFPIAKIGKFTAMITLHFHLQPQYKCELFHINFTSFHCTERYELNRLTSLPMCGFIAQLVEHRTSIAEVRGSNPVEALIFFWLLLSNCLNWKIYYDDHSSLSLTEISVRILLKQIEYPLLISMRQQLMRPLGELIVCLSIISIHLSNC